MYGIEGWFMHRWGRRTGRVLATALVLLLLASASSSALAFDPLPEGEERPQSGATYKIFAHRLGLVGGRTANGHIIQENDFFATLPCFCVLSSKGGNEYQVRITYGDKSIVVPIWDVGPWNIDDNYWAPTEERTWSGLPRGVPQAEAAYFDNYNNGLDDKGREVRSPAGMDIADGAFRALGMTDSDWVEVTFLWLEDDSQGQEQGISSEPPADSSDAESEDIERDFADVPVMQFGERPPLDPAEPKSKPEYFYITQTGHNMPADIWDYWLANGGWRFFGLPISELYVEVRPDGTRQLVQLFERSILEYNPNSDDRPLVQGRHVGKFSDAPDSARQPVEPFESTSKSIYFEETGHSLSNGFKNEWEKRGGLDVFGYPITEEFEGVTPDGRRYVAQVFERARFEWWPDKVGTPEEITYGRLVAERQKELGFLQ